MTGGKVLLLIAGLSVFVQILTAILALRLIGVTGAINAWAFLSIAIILMSARRIYDLLDVFLGNAFFQTDLLPELLGFTTSLFMFAGIVLISPIFKTIKQSEEKQRALTNELKKRLSDIKTLSAMLPICSYCKKIRDDKGYWELLDAYVSKHTDAQFSHGICPECAEKIVADFEGLKRESGH